MTPHPFKPTATKPHVCAVCSNWAGAPWHILEMFSGTDAERETVRQISEAEELTAKMRTVKADVSQASGRMERESPLFFGTGENPCLF